VDDAPERILMASVDMPGDWLTWQPTEPVEVLRPLTDYEGCEYPTVPSGHGSAKEVNQLRDPFVMNREGGVIVFY
jgi:hypothetical protein